MKRVSRLKKSAVIDKQNKVEKHAMYYYTRNMPVLPFIMTENVLPSISFDRIIILYFRLR